MAGLFATFKKLVTLPLKSALDVERGVLNETGRAVRGIGRATGVVGKKRRKSRRHHPKRKRR